MRRFCEVVSLSMLALRLDTQCLKLRHEEPFCDYYNDTI